MDNLIWYHTLKYAEEKNMNWKNKVYLEFLGEGWPLKMGANLELGEETQMKILFKTEFNEKRRKEILYNKYYGKI